jgi:hypothetical protein
MKALKLSREGSLHYGSKEGIVLKREVGDYTGWFKGAAYKKNLPRIRYQ